MAHHQLSCCQVLKLLLDQWTTEKYALRLKDRMIHFVFGERCYRLTSHDGNTTNVVSEESLFYFTRGGTHKIYSALSSGQ